MLLLGVHLVTDQPIRILIVDDHAAVRRALAELIATTTDFELIGEACSGSEALQLVDRYPPDMVLMDISMPGMDGVEATKGILAKHPASTVVVFTSHAGNARIVDALEAGASDYVLKDTDPYEILAQLRSAARRAASAVGREL
jgi:DNA-binding NarL/FixJ family response regulator